MKFAICNETFVDWPHEKAFEFARDCGYTGIEIAPFALASDVKQIDQATRTRIRRLADDTDLEIVGLHWLLAKTTGYYLTSPDPQTRQRTAEYLGELARLCHDLGGRVLVFGSPQQRNLLPGVTHAQAFDYAAEVCRKAMCMLEDLEVTLAIEPLGPAEGDFLNRAADGVELVERVGSPNCRLHLDVKAMSSEGTPIADIIRANRTLLEHFHANDPNRLGPGMGEVDFLPIFEALGEINYCGWVSVEVFDYSPGPERLARDSIDYMQACLERLTGSGA
jgi:sugar phosphate isomerase/epimerase